VKDETMAATLADDEGQDAVLKVDHISVSLSAAAGPLGLLQSSVPILSDVSITVGKGQIVGLVGETGSGKSTLALTIARKHAASSGRICFDGRDITHLHGRQLRELRQYMQIVFQDPFQSLPPSLTVTDIVTEPLIAHGLAPGGRRHRAERAQLAAQLLQECGLPASVGQARPNSLSGGERQRVALARAIATRPTLLIADEPTSALDVLVQAQVLQLLRDLQKNRALSLLLISHNLGVVRYLASHVYVLYNGSIVEHGPADLIFGSPRHPYTQELLQAVPEPGKRSLPARTLTSRDGNDDLPHIAHQGAPRAATPGGTQPTELREVAPGHHVALPVLTERGTGAVSHATLQ
jgi:oligopeptide/dipeptide ABC transporter ATP-binding protein